MRLSQAFLPLLKLSQEDDQKIRDVFAQLRERYKDYQDPWGFNLEKCEQA